MSERGKELLRFYEEKRIKDQLGFYTGRLEHFDRATGQGLFISATILGFASAAGALAGTAVGWAKGWAAAAAILAAVATAITAYLALYAFDQQSKIYGDAVRAVRAASRLTPDPDAGPRPGPRRSRGRPGEPGGAGHAAGAVTVGSAHLPDAGRRPDGRMSQTAVSPPEPALIRSQHRGIPDRRGRLSAYREKPPPAPPSGPRPGRARPRRLRPPSGLSRPGR